MLLLKTEDGETLAEVDKERISIGRDPANEVVLEDSSVSGFHAVILNDRGVVSVVDLGSTNGTAMDGRRVRERTELKAWSSLQLGGVKLRVEDTEGQAPTRVQPMVPPADPTPGDATELRTQVRPAVGGDTQVAAPAPAAGGIRFESLRRKPDTSAKTRIAAAPPAGVSPPPRQERSAGPTIEAPRRTAPTVEAPRAARANPTIQHAGVQPGAGHGPASGYGAEPVRPAVAGDDYARTGGYPRGIEWLLWSFEGRLSRLMFWKCFGVGVALNAVLLLSAAILAALAESDALFTAAQVVFTLAFLRPWLAIYAKRLHDSGIRARPWGVYVVVLSLVSLPFAGIDPSSASPAVGFFGCLFLLLALPSLYLLYLVGIKSGDPGVNRFGDPNPRRGTVFGP